MTVSVNSFEDYIRENILPGASDAEVKGHALHLMELVRARGNVKNGDTRNIHDHLKELSNEEVRDTLRDEASPFVGIFMNVLGDFNVGTAIRSLNAFNGRRAYIVANNSKWDRRGAVGVQNYTDVRRTLDVQSVFDELRAEGYTIVAAELTDDAVPLHQHQWDVKSAVVFGEEGAGLSQKVLDACDVAVKINMRGTVRSFNVASTASMFMYDYTTKLGFSDQPGI